jgi:uncharacterized glyoxalase superfamily protein PhnB
MPGKVNPIPEGYYTATPYLIVKEAARAIDFYKKAFGATELMRMPQPDGKIAHAEIKIGNSPIMLADEPRNRPPWARAVRKRSAILPWSSLFMSMTWTRWPGRPWRPARSC